MGRILFFFLLALAPFFGEPSIVYIHLGSSLPSYLPCAITQARYFNSCPIYLIANASALMEKPAELVESGAICIEAESLPREPVHDVFVRTSRLDRSSREGFWIYTTERFFYLYEFMKLYELRDVFHLEYDNMLYADVSKLLLPLKRFYPGKIAATFDNDGRVIGGFLYISSQEPLRRFVEFVSKNARSRNNDMEFLAQFKQVDYGIHIEHLPIVPPAYTEDHPLVSPHRHTARKPKLYWNHFDVFHAVFDAAAIGQYLGGIDPRNGPSVFGFINESCLFNPSHFKYQWIEDEEGRQVPMMVYRNVRCPIINLHIHSKNLKMFDSRRKKR